MIRDKLWCVFSALSLRPRLCLLIALASIPALSVQIYHHQRSMKAREAEVRAQALRLAQLQASEEGAKIAGAKHFLAALAQAVVTQRPGFDCVSLLSDAVRRSGEFDMLGVTDAA